MIQYFFIKTNNFLIKDIGDDAFQYIQIHGGSGLMKMAEVKLFFKASARW